MTTLKEQNVLVEEQKTKLETVPEDVKKLVTIANKLKSIETVSSLEKNEIDFISKYSSEEDLRNIFEDLLLSTKGFFEEYTPMKNDILKYKEECSTNRLDIIKKNDLITELKKSLKQSDKLNMYLSCVIGLMFISLVVVLFLK